MARLRLAKPIIPTGSKIASHIRFLGASGRSPKELTLADTAIVTVACAAAELLKVTVVGATEHVT
jgi:hypothetical protein